MATVPQWSREALPTEPVQNSQAPPSKGPESQSVDRILSPLKAAAAAAEEAKRLLSLSNSWALEGSLQSGLRPPRSGPDRWSTSSPSAGHPPGSVLSEDQLDLSTLRNPRSWWSPDSARLGGSPSEFSELRGRAQLLGGQSPSSPWGDSASELGREEQQQPESLFKQQEAQLKDLHQQQQRIRHELELQQTQSQSHRSRSPLPSFGAAPPPPSESAVSEVRFKKAVQDLQDTFESRFKQFEKSLEERLEERFQQINDDISWAGSHTDSLAKRFEQFSTIFEKTIEDLAKRAELAEAGLDTLARAAEQGSQGPKAPTQEEQEQSRAKEARLWNFEQELAGLRERLQRLEEETYGEQGWVSKVKEHDVKLQGLRSKLESQDQHFATFGEAAKQDWEKRFKSLQENFRDHASQQMGLGEKLESIHRWTEATEDAMDDLRKVCERSFAPSATRFSQSARLAGSCGEDQKLPGFGSPSTSGKRHDDGRGDGSDNGAKVKSQGAGSEALASFGTSAAPAASASPSTSGQKPPFSSTAPSSSSAKANSASCATPKVQGQTQAFVDSRMPVLLDPVGPGQDQEHEFSSAARASSAPPSANRGMAGGPSFGARGSPGDNNNNNSNHRSTKATTSDKRSSPSLPPNSASTSFSATNQRADATANAFGIFGKQSLSSSTYQSSGQPMPSSSRSAPGGMQKGAVDSAPRFGNFDWDSEAGKDEEEERLPAFGGSHKG